MQQNNINIDLSKPVMNLGELLKIIEDEKIKKVINISEKNKKYYKNIRNFIEKLKKYKKVAFVIIDKSKEKEYNMKLLEKTFNTIKKAFELEKKQIILMDYEDLDPFSKNIIIETPFTIIYEMPNKKNGDIYLKYLNKGYLLLTNLNK